MSFYYFTPVIKVKIQKKFHFLQKTRFFHLVRKKPIFNVYGFFKCQINVTFFSQKKNRDMGKMHKNRKNVLIHHGRNFTVLF